MAGFFDGLRRELFPGCHAKAHVTVLPPRPISCSPGEAWEKLRNDLQDFTPFALELGELCMFPMTQVIYVSVGRGRRELERMHAALNRGPLQFIEPFAYKPHLTVAQDLLSGDVDGALELAQRRWGQFWHPRDFTLDHLTFVQNTLGNRWQDLDSCALSSH
jgi:2'-5' RNA ligase